jgi:ribosomal protein S18 acetylase RimI-like enzyme
MINNLNIKLATLDDLEAMKEVGDQLFDLPVKTERAMEFLEDSRHHLVLAYIHSKVVGMASGFHYVHPDKDPELFINEVGVIEEYQNKGIGSELVKFICETGKNLGCKEAWTATENSNNAAIKCYLNAGGLQGEKSTVHFHFQIL